MKFSGFLLAFILTASVWGDQPISDPSTAITLGLDVYTRAGQPVELVGFNQYGDLVGQIAGGNSYYVWRPNGEDFTEGDSDWDLVVDIPVEWDL